MSNVRITILSENSTADPVFLTEHGLSLWIECSDRRVLFDTGQSDQLVRNAEALGIDLSEAEAIVLSHGHYDHTGGLATVLNIAADARIYLHPAAVEAKYSRKADGARYIGMPDSARKAIEGRDVVWTAAATEIVPGMIATGEVPRSSSFEEVGGAFFLDEDCKEADQLADDQSLFVESEKGLVVIAGCAHSGIVNTVDYVAELTGDKRMHAVFGGMHLLRAGEMRIARTIEAFKKYEIQKIVPLHCTGQAAVESFADAFADACLSLGVGGRITFC